MGPETLNDLVARVHRVQRPGEAAFPQVGQQEPADARAVVAGAHHGDRPGTQERIECDTGGDPLVRENGLEVGIGLLDGEAGVHANRGRRLLVHEPELGQALHHDGVTRGEVAAQSAYPDVVRVFRHLAEEQGAEARGR